MMHLSSSIMTKWKEDWQSQHLAMCHETRRYFTLYEHSGCLNTQWEGVQSEIPITIYIHV